MNLKTYLKCLRLRGVCNMCPQNIKEIKFIECYKCDRVNDPIPIITIK